MDFMGLNSVKEEVSYGVSDSVTAAASKVPHFSSHISASKDTPNKASSSGFSQNLAGLIFKSSPSAGSNTGLADARNKSAVSPAQMTVFYNGTVKVYDSITPEKAQAIMFLAGNASCLVTSDARAGAQVRPPTPKYGSSATDVVLPFSQCVNGQSFSTISSPISVSSLNVAQSMSSSTSTHELVNNNKSTLSPFSSDCKMMAAFGSAASPSMMSRGIPQFRKVSLARFLEKRRDRVMNAAPYNALPKKPEKSIQNKTATLLLQIREYSQARTDIIYSSRGCYKIHKPKPYRVSLQL